MTSNVFLYYKTMSLREDIWVFIHIVDFILNSCFERQFLAGHLQLAGQVPSRIDASTEQVHPFAGFGLAARRGLFRGVIWCANHRRAAAMLATITVCVLLCAACILTAHFFCIDEKIHQFG